MILVWGLLQDPSTEAVLGRLKTSHIDTIFLNHAEIYRTIVTASAGQRLSYEVSCNGQVFQLEHLSAAYLRPYDYHHYSTTASNLETSNANDSQPAMVHHLVSTWAEYTPALVISRPSAEGTNRSKLYQATEILACGFRYPESLVTNDPAEIRNFARRRRRVIYKSMSNVRSIVKALSIDDLEGKKLGPVFFQHLIEGQNVRVHVVGEDCFACAIDTDGVDYRYASSYMRPVQLPPEVRNKAVALTRKLQLVLAGIDLILADTGDWYCLEVNPNPGFASFHDGDLIADAVAHLLLQADRASSASA